MSLVHVEDLTVDFGRRRRVAIEDVSFTIDKGERVGLIGESGSGKSVTALSLLGLLPENAHATGTVHIDGHDMLALPERERAGLRGNLMSMIFQEPMTALDPTMKVGRQVAEVLLLHHGIDNSAARPRVIAMLDAVGLPNPERVAESYPHQLSGGQRQRVVIAMALVNSPQLVICDEPTTALDVTVQAMVLRLLDESLSAVDAACLFISHDLAVVSQICSRVLVMLDGRIVEHGPTEVVFTTPEHPYTKGLVATARIADRAPGSRLPTVEDFLAEER